jgi:DNA-binding MarR family transcriptional regulator
MINILSETVREGAPAKLTEISIQQKVMLTRAAHFIAQFRSLSSDLQIPTALIFMSIAQEPGIIVKTMMRKTKLSQSSCSRNIALLSQTDRHGKPGHGLIEARPDPSDSRRQMIYLTPKGVEFMAILKDILR